MEELKPCPFCGCTAVEIFPTLARGIFAARCAACHMYGPHSENEDCAVERWNALPRRLRWTREKPTKDGYYWYKDKITMQMIALVDASTEAVEFFMFPGETCLDALDGEWAGPIPEPE